MIEIKENTKEGFEDAVVYGDWKVAYITYSEQYSELREMKRHTKTDEVVILLCGTALISTYENGTLLRTQMEKGKLYNIKKNTWHHISISKDAMLFAIENSDTTKENTERMILGADKGNN